MSHSKKPAEWEIFNIPPIKPVQYYSLLKKNREFSQLIQQYDAQVFKKSYVHYCSIVPQSTHPSLNNTFELFIVFFDEVPSSFLGFRVNVSKETYIYESNSLLLFLKKSHKVIFYRMNNNCIHVQCGTSAWHLFYLLYDIYLRRYILTVIGTRFFHHFVYSCCIQNEKQMLEMLYRGSKIIKISKKSIYYKIHRKRKISVTDLIHMTLNMPKNKRYVISCFSPKNAVMFSNFNSRDVYTITGKKVHVSELRMIKYIETNNILSKSVNFKEKKPSYRTALFTQSASQASPENEYESQKKNYPLSLSNMKPKRKFENLGIQTGTSSKYFKISDSSSFHCCWEQYHNLKYYIAKNCLGLPLINTLNPDLVQSGSSHFNLHSPKKSHDTSFISGSDTLNHELDTQNTIELIDHKNKLPSEYSRDDNNKTVSVSSISYKPERNETKNISTPMSQDACSDVPIFLKHNPCSDSKFEFAVKTPNETLSQYETSEETNFDSSDSLWQEDENITTAAGKTISISTSAMLKAQHMILSDFCDGYKEINAVITDSTENKKCNKYHKKSTTKYMKVTDTSDGKISLKDSLRNNERITTNFTSEGAIDKSFKPSLDIVNDVSLSTAAGNTINISNTAMEAAKKLIQNVFDEKELECFAQADLPTHSKKKSNVSAFRDIGFSSKVVDVDMDESLVEKFFEDTHFDEDENLLVNSENVDSVLKSKSNLSTNKPRKSLGGRRSLRYIPDKF